MRHLDAIFQHRAQIGPGFEDREVRRRVTNIGGRLRGVDVELGIDGIVDASRATESLIGDVGDDLVHIHVDGDAAASAEQINRKMIEVIAGNQRIATGLDGIGDFRRTTRASRLARAAAFFTIASARTYRG